MADEFRPMRVLDCPNCQRTSLSWDGKCPRCHVPAVRALMPPPAYDDADRHRQENAA